MALTDKLTAIANAIRTKTGGTEQLTLDDMVTAINDISSGGGGSDDVLKGIIDGTLTELIIPNGITTIRNYAFERHPSLASVTIPESVKSIGEYAFYFCTKLASVTIPEGVTSIYSSAFYGCNRLQEIHLKPTTPPYLASISAFGSISSNCIMYVPQGCLEAYQTATNWSTYASRMQEEPA